MHDYKNKEYHTSSLSDPDYPSLLKEIDAPPKNLFYKGLKLLDYKFAVAIVGSRKCTKYGISAAKYFSREISRIGITIISGMAEGIDRAAHVEAINEKGGSIGVLGCGFDFMYPKSNQDLYDRILENGSLVSEYKPEMPPRKENFPHRNRIISGLSLGIIVVEAAQRSGALMTAGFARKQNRAVFSVPGNIFNIKSKGTNDLIKRGAKLATSIEDILHEIRKEHFHFFK